MKPSVLSAAACLLAAAAAAAAFPPPAARAEREPAGRADDFVDSIGVGTRWSWADTPYVYDFARVEALLGDLGVRHVRDSASPLGAGLCRDLGVRTAAAPLLDPAADPAAAARDTVVTGFHTALSPAAVNCVGVPGVSEAAQAKYVLRALCLGWQADSRRTFVQELIDPFPDYGADPRAAWNAAACAGIVRHDLTPKPAYAALKNLIAVLAERRWDPAARRWADLRPPDARTPPAPGALAFTLTAAAAPSGGAADLRHVLLRKTTGSGNFYLLLWRETPSFDPAAGADIANPPAAVTLAFPARVSGGRVFQPGASPAPLRTFAATRRLDLSVPDDVLVVEIWPGSGSGAAAPPAARRPVVK